jgi:predicted  nucleic acid-binding Zn-ribbon protein
MNTKSENIQKQIAEAERKIEAIRLNTQNLEIKKQNIEKQIIQNGEKIKKIEFFLQKIQKTQEN